MQLPVHLGDLIPCLLFIHSFINSVNIYGVPTIYYILEVINITCKIPAIVELISKQELDLRFSN